MLAAFCMGIAACSSDDDVTTSQSDHQPIQLSSNLSATIQTRAAFTSSTWMKLYLSGTNADDNAKAAVTSSTDATAAVQNESGVSAVTFTSQPYWDDFYGRSAKLSIYGIALANSSAAIDFGTDLTAIPMTLTANQSTTGAIAKNDYVYTNNLSGDGCLKYNNGFPTGNLNFKHLMSKITVNVVGSDGYTVSTTGANLLMKNFPASATFNLNGCTWGNYGTAADITASAKTTAAEGYTLSYEALVLPGSRNPNDATDKANTALALTVNSSTFNIALQDILASGVTTLESNKNYTVNITISKTGISMTASVEDWVNADATNAIPYMAVEADATTATSGSEKGLSFDLYMASQGSTDYGTNKWTAVTYNSETSKYSYAPMVYWPSSDGVYNLRGVTPGTTISKESDDKGSYVAVTTIDASNNSTGDDLFMGAPYSAYTDYANATISSGIKATSSTVGLIFNHMKPKIDIQLTSASGDDGLDLSDAKVTINNIYTTGKFLLKDLTCSVTGNAGICNVSTDGTASATSHNYRFYAIPQTLDNLTMTITIGSKYTFTATLKTTDVTSWISGKAYTYKLTIGKTSINKMEVRNMSWTVWNVDAGTARL